MASLSLQEKYWPTKVCYGCGPANPKGLHVRSHIVALGLDDAAVAGGAYAAEAVWTPWPEHTALPNVANGGVLSTILDCHSNILAAYCAMRARGETEKLPSMTVTAQVSVKFLQPTPMQPLRLVAVADPSRGDAAKGKVWVKAFVLPAAVGAEPGTPDEGGHWGDLRKLAALEPRATAACDGLFVALREKK